MHNSSWQKSIEVCQMFGGWLVQRSEHPLTLTESTANVPHVTEKLRHEAFSNRPVKLLNSKNLPIPDVEGTKGKFTVQNYVHIIIMVTGGKFWRTAKVIRAVSVEDFDELEQQRNPRPHTKPATIELSDSDSHVFESIPPPSFKRRKVQAATTEEVTPQRIYESHFSSKNQ